MSGFRDKLKAVFNDHTPGSSNQQPYSRPAPPRPYWTASFAAGQNVSDEWRQEQGDHGWGNNEMQNYTDSHENAFFRKNAQGQPSLVLRAIVDTSRATSARLTSRVTLGRDEGYISARITAPCARGVWPAFWMLPSEPFNWPTDGEIDIMESWNGERLNHSCLHWGQHNGPDHDKHRVVRTTVRDLDHPQGKTYGFAWQTRQGRLMWFIDGKPVMQTKIPYGARKMSDFQIKLNIALGGDVNGGVKPADGFYDMEVHEIGMYETPPGGWAESEKQMRQTPDGKP